MNEIFVTDYTTSAGKMILGSYNGKLCLCDWEIERRRARIDKKIQKKLSAQYICGISNVIERTINELNEYFVGEREDFDIPLLLLGTDFQNKVWRELTTIPYGTTISYSYLAEKIGVPKAVRAVSNANAANPISILIPCHRVIGSNGLLTGYGGGLEAKRILIELESNRKLKKGNSLEQLW